LGALAVVTKHIRLGTLLTPPSRRRPWKLANETATLDALSKGRAILSVGLGALDTGFAEFGEETERAIRAELLDETIDVLTGLWTGKPIEYQGKHYQIKKTNFDPGPAAVQQPRIPIWCVGAWNYPRSMRRVLKCDGILPTIIDKDNKFAELTPEHVGDIKNYVAANRTLVSSFDIIVENTSPGDDPTAAAEKIQPWIDAGATWWIESMWSENDPEKWYQRLRQGPPGKGPGHWN
jgi:alkanesulfonate monooxygenase SsuD/methylene tetrahydromethanopterin reductase-like flavin-dependent oxidoreductase (luciferase family)